MNSKPHRTNSDFQLRHFLAGSCHTPDGAWTLMYGQKIDIEGKIKNCEAQRLRRNAQIAKARHFLDNNPNAPEHERLEEQANIIEVEASQEVWELNLQAAKEELVTIMQIMAELEPLRKHRDMSLLEASEASQREEWLGELKRRAENFIVSQGTIPHDHLNTMRCHPDFESELVPYIRKLGGALRSAPDGLELLKKDTLVLLDRAKS